MLADEEPLPTAIIDSGMSSDVFAHGPDQVLKLFRKRSVNAITHEFEASRLAHGLGLPVPRPIAITERDGRPAGIVFERLHGATMMRHYAGKPIGFVLALRRLAIIQHAIHRCAAPGLPSQHAVLRARAEQSRVPEAVRRATLAALDRLPGGDRLCHGDIHPDNVLQTPDGLAIIDWLNATAGNPAADVARTELMIRFGRMKRPKSRWRVAALRAARDAVAAWYVRCYRTGSGMTLAEIAAWRLPLAVARLAGQPAENEAEVLAFIETVIAKLSRESQRT